MIRLALVLIGGTLAAFGVIWALQGLGVLLWPAESAMIAQREWALYGGIAIVFGLLIAWLASRSGGGRD